MMKNGISMIPFGLLSGFMDGKEIRIIELAEEGFRFRLSEKAASPESFLVCFYDMEQADYHEIEIRNYTIEEDNVSSELVEFCMEYTVLVNSESYRQEVRKLQGQYSRYIRLKLEDDDEELARALTGYPEKKPVNYYSLEERQNYSLETAIEIDRPELYREYLQNDIKQLIEQKAAFSVGKNMSEYTNPGPIINNVYIPTRNNQGVLSTQQIGGDVNVGDLVDLDYYEDKLFGGLRVPKQYFGRTDDSAGFSGGQSLSIISSRYAKMIKRIQNVIIQMITDAINLILIDTGNENYINKFTLKMLSPTTQEEVDRRDNMSNKVGIVGDIMNTLSDIEDTATRLKILKSLLSDTLTNAEVISLIQEQIDALETEETPMEDSSIMNDESEEDLSGLFGDDTSSENRSSNFDDFPELDSNSTTEFKEPASEEGNDLPLPSDLGIGDLSDSTNPELEA